MTALLRQVQQRWPQKDRRMDGIMRDPRVGPPSDHHLGNALDLTHDPAHGFDAGRLAESFRRQMLGNPVGGRLTYVIWGRQIASGRTGWRWVPYRRSCPHLRHIHISIKASHREVVRPWTLY